MAHFIQSGKQCTHHGATAPLFHTGNSLLQPLFPPYTPPTKRLRSAQHPPIYTLSKQRILLCRIFLSSISICVNGEKSKLLQFSPEQFQAEATETSLFSTCLHTLPSHTPLRPHGSKHLHDTPSAHQAWWCCPCHLVPGPTSEMAHLATQILQKRQQLELGYVWAVTCFLW